MYSRVVDPRQLVPVPASFWLVVHQLPVATLKDANKLFTSCEIFLVWLGSRMEESTWREKEHQLVKMQNWLQKISVL